jgi:hypothetical protein
MDPLLYLNLEFDEWWWAENFSHITTYHFTLNDFAHEWRTWELWTFTLSLINYSSVALFTQKGHKFPNYKYVYERHELF